MHNLVLNNFDGILTYIMWFNNAFHKFQDRLFKHKQLRNVEFFFRKNFCCDYSFLKLLWFLNFLEPIGQEYYVNSCILGLDVLHTQIDKVGRYFIVP